MLREGLDETIFFLSEGNTMSDVNNSNVPVEKTGEQEGGAAAPKKTVTRRQVLAMAGCGVAGLVVGGVLASGASPSAPSPLGASIFARRRPSSS